MALNEYEKSLTVFLNKKKRIYPLKKHLLETYSCVVCYGLLRFPQLLGACGHRACEECLNILLKNNNPCCPVDQNELDSKKVIPDIILEKEVHSINVQCFNAAQGCPWNGVQNSLMIHSEKCLYKAIPCEFECGMNGILAVNMKDHYLKECKNAPVECDMCHMKVKRPKLNEHKMEKCAETILYNCPENCGFISKEGFRRKELSGHFEIDCSVHVSSCVFGGAGCNFKGNKKAKEKHEMECVNTHMDLVVKAATAYVDDKAEELYMLKQIAYLKKKSRILSYLYERQYFWRIGNFKQSFKDAQKVSHEEIKSPVISTSRIGYRLQFITSLYGEGRYQGQYMSVHARICPGEYDDLLSWPFSQIITLTLLDQCMDIDNRNHLPYTLNPKNVKDKKSLSKPSPNSKNPLFGTETFVKLEDSLNHEHYCLNDSIYILIEAHD
ncbi:hypothetical protein HELRODRAFT_175057 [Helobdella robusta]|uniref:RING-type E3 ubiquitin transferase n=1 Tax=Helobdella robusta TaxID=6412 RepID=T1F8S7_HELRO|nr:hypothetical protein HELRODRAFT_175057 [Helobdella robusta]ESO01032.1 hypothetical protein HELRODRAFT_175057 [Helobdella robusta]